jgi:DUF4097 and DUF4098 domain-containing protein YvlB
MKINSLFFIICLTLAMVTHASYHGKYQHHEKINHTYQFKQQSADNTLYIYNINGSVQIQGYDGEEIQVAIEKTLMAKHADNLQQAKNETQFKVVEHKQQIHMFLKTPFSSLTMKDGEMHFHESNNKQKYQYKLDYKIKVPKNTNLNILAVNDGIININNIQAKLIYAKNINGAIELNKVSGAMQISTVNGDVLLNYLNNNIKNSRFKSVNGSFNINFVEQPSIEITYKTLNGHLYTTFETSKSSSFVQQQYQHKKQGIKYKIKGKNQVRIGSGTYKFHFKTINGDINISKQA